MSVTYQDILDKIDKTLKLSRDAQVGQITGNRGLLVPSLDGVVKDNKELKGWFEDENDLQAENIRDGVTIFGVEGNVSQKYYWHTDDNTSGPISHTFDMGNDGIIHAVCITVNYENSRTATIEIDGEKNEGTDSLVSIIESSKNVNSGPVEVIADNEGGFINRIILIAVAIEDI